MGLRAVDCLTDAFDATRAFLTPVDGRQWAKLAAVVFFLWGTAGSGTSSSDGADAGDGPSGGGVSIDVGQGSGSTVPVEGFGSLGGDLSAAILVIVAAVSLLGIAYLFVGSVMEFVLVESLRSEAVALRAYWREHLGRGVRLFAFRVAFLLAAGGVLLLPVFLVFVPGAPLGPIALFALIPVLFGLVLVAAVVNEFTTVFAVPIMIAEDRGVLAAWRRLWGAVRADPTEFLAYAGLKFVLSIVAGAVVGAVIAIPAVVVFLPVGVLGGLAVFGGDPSLLTVLAIGALGLVALAVVLAMTAVVQVPVVTYFRYYGLLLLGDVDADLDLVPDRRAAIRADGSGEPDAADDGSDGRDAADDDGDR